MTRPAATEITAGSDGGDAAADRISRPVARAAGAWRPRPGGSVIRSSAPMGDQVCEGEQVAAGGQVGECGPRP
ncbi:hypothetical protein, partial [Nocardia seriolae]|uniref:hypothetical protein n=1 Tax=Nocardia seriolae TaxID=37332 RepID=UPI001E45AA66